MNAIEVKNISKVYKSKNEVKYALDSVNLVIPRGSIFAILGLNGAGKTTLIKLILGLIKPTNGEIKFLDNDIKNRKVGYLPESFQSIKELTAISILKFLGKLSGMSSKQIQERSLELLNYFQLFDSKNQKLKTFSKGMNQRLGIIQSVLNNPDLLILDEPTDGLDPAGKKLIRNFLIELKEKGKTVIINSHLLSEVELIADYITILHRGKIVSSQKLSDFINRDTEFEIITKQELKNYPEYEVTKNGSEYHISVIGAENIQKLLSVLKEQNIEALKIEAKQKSLEDMFFSMIGEDKRL